MTETRREKALKACMKIRYGSTRQVDPDSLMALADEYDDLLAFFDAWEQGHDTCCEHYEHYCDNQGSDS